MKNSRVNTEMKLNLVKKQGINAGGSKLSPYKQKVNSKIN